jgi:purine-binding chemotaxis protein CheW
MTAPIGPPDRGATQAAARLDGSALPGGASRVTPERRAQILAERARAISASRAIAQEQSLVVLAFRVGGERYAIPAEEVRQVLESKGITPLIGAPRWMLGAMLARSQVVPVLDLRHLIGLEGGGLSDLTRVLVIDQQDDVFGLAVESVEAQLSIPLSALTTPPPGPFRWVGPERLAILDVSQLGAEAGPARS